MLKPAEMAKLAVEAMAEKKAQDITVMRTTDVTVLADYFVLCTASSTTHIKTISDAVEHILTEAGEPPRRREGERSSGWVLIDFGCVVIHVFMDEARTFYDLERLWADAEKIDIAQLG